MDAIIWEWANLILRWIHVITAIAWIGSSFYFVHLDASLKKAVDLPQGAGGQTWQVHGGGFYHMVKYLVAPAQLPKELTWFKWEAYTTWISGFFLLIVLYYAGADLYLVDPSVLQLPPWAAIAIGVASLAVGWLAYDGLCRSPIAKDDRVLAFVGWVGLVVVAWLFTRVFGGRGAFIQTGAVIGTMMSGNVFWVIIPNQKKVVAALLAGQQPDPLLGKQAKQRSMHNNYLTLPVLFLMIGNHYPLAFATRWNWAIIGIVLIVGAVIRHFYNERHAGNPSPWWTWGVAAVGMLLVVWLSSLGPRDAAPGTAALPATAPAFAEVADIVTSRCAVCHTSQPVWAGVNVPPKGVLLDSPELVRLHARDIDLQAVLTHAMPPANVTEITPEERQTLAAWFANGATAD